jgi:Bacterial Ig domain
MRRAFLFTLINLLLNSLLDAQQFTDGIAPTAAITSPANGVTVKGLVSINVDACDNVGVAKVEFFVDGSLIGTDKTYPYSFSWSSRSVPNGSHSFKSKAYDAATNSTTSAIVNITVNNEFVPPTTSITSPLSGALLQGNVTVNATASDNVAVARVEFYADSTLIGIDNTFPYSISWNSMTIGDGSHVLSAKAWDTSENATTSAAVPITIDNNSPTIAITSPLNSAYLRGIVTIAANATDSVGVTKVEFYVDGNLIGSDVSSPYNFNWNTTGVVDGNHVLACRAYDQIGHVTVSGNATVKVDNAPPLTSLTSPVGGTVVTFSITVTANASDNLSLNKVEFYADSILIASDTTSPYSAVWNSVKVSNGIHQLKCKAYDQAGNSTTSTAVNVIVNNPLILFQDDFEDGSASNWTFTGGTWSVVSGNLTGNGTSQKALAPFNGCVNCSIQADLQTAGGTNSNVSFVGWYQDSQNYVELIAKVNANSWDLIQKSAGKNAAKQSFTTNIKVNTNYRLKLSFDGTNFKAHVDGALIITMPKGASPSGKVGFGVDNTTGTFPEIFVY